MFHLITHAFFKALLFLGAGSVIHGCHDEQDIHRMGGLRRLMPVTFITYAIGMMALSGVPLAFSGFWSKDGILESAHAWRGSHLPFYLGLVAAFLTAFYMTRQVAFVFLGQHRPSPEHPGAPHESPRVMLVPLVLLAGGSILLGFIGTPAWPWFQAFLNGSSAEVAVRHLFEPAVIQIMITSSIVAMAGIGAGYWLYGRGLGAGSLASDAVERLWPNLFTLLQHKYYVDEAYNWLFVRGTNAWGRLCRWLDDWIWGGAVLVITYGLIGLSWLHRWFDEYVVNLGFDQQCRGLVGGGHLLSRLQNGYIHRYLRLLALGLAVLVLLLTWGCQKA
jgi:NADH-quinone oxidoreductase subunit L